MSNDILSVRVAQIAGADCSNYVASDAWPNLRGEPWFWLDLLDELNHGKTLPYDRVVCGVYVPDYAGSLELAQNTATKLSVAYTDADDAAAVCGKIVSALGA